MSRPTTKVITYGDENANAWDAVITESDESTHIEVTCTYEGSPEDPVRVASIEVFTHTIPSVTVDLFIADLLSGHYKRRALWGESA